MTITEQLQFSVLSAPVATVDRRALSQAWYSALYGSASSGRAQPAAVPKARPVNRRTQQSANTATPASTSRSQVSRDLAHGNEPYARGETPVAERRATRSALARKIERTFLQPQKGARKASFTIDGRHGRVHVLLRSDGAQVKLIAVCPATARTQVAAALAQARYALALRGIAVEARTQEREEC